MVLDLNPQKAEQLQKGCFLHLNKEFKPLKKSLLRDPNLNPLKAGQLQKRCFQLLLIVTYPAIVRLGSVADSCKRSNLVMVHGKPNN